MPIGDVLRKPLSLVVFALKNNIWRYPEASSICTLEDRDPSSSVTFQDISRYYYYGSEYFSNLRSPFLEASLINIEDPVCADFLGYLGRHSTLGGLLL